MTEKKRKQHYVWRGYLRSWAEREQIWCRRDSKIFKVNLMNIAQERDFYRLRELSSKDVAFLKLVIGKATGNSLRRANLGQLEFFGKIFEMQSKIKLAGLWSEDLEGEFDREINNLEENWLQRMEDVGSEYISMLLERNTSFYSNSQDILAFLHFLSLQQFRTKKMQDKMARQFREKMNFDITAAWPVLRNIISLNIATAVFRERERYKLILMENGTESPFVTGDQPVINIYGVGKPPYEPVDELEYYYPISPDLAIIISEREEMRHLDVIEVTSEQVRWYNNAVASESHEQMFSNSKASLESLAHAN
ncbi:TPA: DUF4238 domain-containing protein [Burkholderia lata]